MAQRRRLNISTTCEPTSAASLGGLSGVHCTVEPNGHPSVGGLMKSLCTAFILLWLGAAAPALAKVDQPVADRCHTLSLKAHPASLPDVPAVTNLRESFYNLCVTRRGTMNPLLANPSDAGQ
jgi:hypothetical protein